ncbi:MAG: hypothetical protein VB957_00760 [Pseudomonadales bacterium]
MKNIIFPRSCLKRQFRDIDQPGPTSLNAPKRQDSVISGGEDVL